MRKSRSVYNNRTYILVNSRSTDISIIDQDLVDVLTDRKPAEQSYFLCFIGEERKALNVQRVSFIFILLRNLPLYGKL